MDNDVVHGSCVKDAVTIAYHLSLHHPAPIFLKLAAQHGLENGLIVIKCNIGDEAQAALIDTN